MTMLQQNELWTRFMTAAWATKKAVDTGTRDDRIWINADLFLATTRSVMLLADR